LPIAPGPLEKLRDERALRRKLFEVGPFGLCPQPPDKLCLFG
jgi:hypothetical protein